MAWYKLKLALFLVFALVAQVRCSPALRQEKPKLRFNSDGNFKIVHFADLHYGEFPSTDRGRAQDGNSTRVITDILGYEIPDFVVFTGDLITGEGIFFNSTKFIEAMLEPLVQGDYRWATTYGNHDNGVTTTRQNIFDTESAYPNCYTKNDGSQDLPGLTNYYLEIYPSTEIGEGEDPVLILWFFDSQGGFDLESGLKPSIVDESVVAWFIEENTKMAEEWGPIPALAYFHIPTIHYEDVQSDIPTRNDCAGLVDENVIEQDKDTGLMAALVNSGTVMTTFVGHDHDNAWCCPYKSLEICYNRHTGYGGYGSHARGARVVELSERNITNRSNYIRLENGEIIDKFPSDVVPTTESGPSHGSRYSSSWKLSALISGIILFRFHRF